LRNTVSFSIYFHTILLINWDKSIGGNSEKYP
jgi:hypothetical protein